MITPQKLRYLVIIFAGIILLLSGVGTSYFWLTRIYLPEQIDANEHARLLRDWNTSDKFTPPADGRITRRKLHQFIQVNESLTFLARRLQEQFEDHSWRFAFDMIEVQPEWAASKYLALEKHNLSPREYDWIFDQVVTFMIDRWKEKALRKLQSYGWDFSQTESLKQSTKINYDLFVDNERELKRMLEVFWPEEENIVNADEDSL